MEGLEKYDAKRTYEKSKYAAKKGGFNMNFMKNQSYSKACKNIFAQISQKVTTGNIKNILSISKPIQMCDTNSYVQIIANQLYQSSKYFKKAYQESDPATIMNWLAVGSISGITANLHTLAGRIPLDVLIGETYQGQLQDGTKIYIECISRLPPLLIVIVTNQKTGFLVESFYHSTAGINGVNSLTGGSKGKTIFLDKNKRKYIIEHGNIVIDGVIYGDPVFNLLDPYKIICQNQNLQAIIKFDGYTNDYAVMKVAKGIMGMFYSKQEKSKDSIQITIYKIDPKSENSIKNQIAKGTGSWLSHIQINGLIYWKYKQRNTTWTRSENLLPSDSKFRLDKRYLISNKMNESQKQKIKMQEQQRLDEQLRASYRNHSE